MRVNNYSQRVGIEFVETSEIGSKKCRVSVSQNNEKVSPNMVFVHLLRTWDRVENRKTYQIAHTWASLAVFFILFWVCVFPLMRLICSVGKHAEDIFSELFHEANAFYLRANSLQDRIDRLAVKVTQLDSTVEEGKGLWETRLRVSTRYISLQDLSR